MAAPVKKNDTTCASCGARRDQHNRPGGTPCPRFVEPPNVQIPHGVSWKPTDVILTIDGDVIVPGQLVPMAPTPAPESKAYIDQRLAGLERRITDQLDRMKLDLEQNRNRIAALEKRAQAVSLDPRIDRAARERIDYTQWRDDEDNLTDDTRQMPEVKQRVRF